MTPERDRRAERERSRLRRLNMTGTDERRSRSRSGTPSRGDNLVPQPVFLSHPGSQSHSGTGTPQILPVLPLAVMPVDDDPFRIYMPDHPEFINLNDDDMDVMQNLNASGPLSQEGIHLEWQLPIPPIPPPIPSQPLPPIQPPVPSQPPIQLPQAVPSQPPAQIVAGVRRRAARFPHPRYPSKLWCTTGTHWVESAVFGRLLTCETCRVVQRSRAARLRNERLAQEAQVAAQLQLAAQIGANGPQDFPMNNPPPPPPPPSHLPPDECGDGVL